MRKLWTLIFVGLIIRCSSSLFAVQFEIKKFRMTYFVYFEVLHRIQGISTKEFDNVIITEEFPTRIKFEYAGKNYAAYYLSPGAIYVDMPEGIRDRYISTKKFPALILHQLDNKR
ncbi:MAG: hypothetical protein ACRCVW_02805 [Brevinema sp.]